MPTPLNSTFQTAPRPTWMGAQRSQNDPWDMQTAIQADLAKRRNQLLPQGKFVRQAFDPSRLPQWNPMSGETQPQYQSRSQNSWNTRQDQLAQQDARNRLGSVMQMQARQVGTGARFPGNMNYQQWVGEDATRALGNYRVNNPESSTFAAWNQKNNLGQNVAPAARPTPYQGADISALFAQFMQQYRPKG